MKVVLDESHSYIHGHVSSMALERERERGARDGWPVIPEFRKPRVSMGTDLRFTRSSTPYKQDLRRVRLRIVSERSYETVPLDGQSMVTMFTYPNDQSDWHSRLSTSFPRPI